jgi:hypothetical protein
VFNDLGVVIETLRARFGVQRVGYVRGSRHEAQSAATAWRWRWRVLCGVGGGPLTPTSPHARVSHPAVRGRRTRRRPDGGSTLYASSACADRA